MPEKPLRIALVGAATLLGKALSDELAASAFSSADIQLMDDEDSFGKLEATAEEMTFIQHIDADSFEGCDFTFFAGPAEITRKHWRRALQAGSRIVDLSGVLEDEPGVLVRAPWVQEKDKLEPHRHGEFPDLQTRVVVPAHPVAALLALVAVRVESVAPIREIWATVLQPASEYGQAALEELHQQTANLLSFQPLPTQVFGSQTAFNLAVSFPAEGRIDLARAADAIRVHFQKISGLSAVSIALQLLQVPVFHGYGISVALGLETSVSSDALRHALEGPHVHVIAQAAEFPGNVQAVEEIDAQVLAKPVLRKEQAEDSTAERFWLWIVADNLKLAAQNAVACATELNRLRPRGGVQ